MNKGHDLGMSVAGSQYDLPWRFFYILRWTTEPLLLELGMLKNYIHVAIK